jgi:Aspartate racemase
VQVIVLGCTELPLLLRGSTLTRPDGLVVRRCRSDRGAGKTLRGLRAGRKRSGAGGFGTGGAGHGSV